jgi:thiopurine S-methyltransferase
MRIMKQTVDWHRHWTRPNPGFHEGQVNRYLLKYLPLFSLPEGATIFVPLCGKAVDILWLSQQGFKVIGVELSQVAVESFFEESSVDFSTRQDGEFTRYDAQNITLYQGDFLHLNPMHLQDCALVYDRASIVAIESFNRAAYQQKMLQFIPPATPMLMVTLDYDQSQMSGPPFSVPVSEIRELYQNEYDIDVLESNEQIEERSRWRDQGLSSLIETALKLTPKVERE